MNELGSSSFVQHLTESSQKRPKKAKKSLVGRIQGRKKKVIEEKECLVNTKEGKSCSFDLETDAKDLECVQGKGD